MLFNSPIFLFCFLPATLIIVRLALRRSVTWAIRALIGASIIFYGWWKHDDVALMAETLTVIGVSIVTNFTIATSIVGCRPRQTRLALLWMGIGFNLALLGYFKYANFFVQNIDAFFGISTHTLDVVLPLGISFYSFQQIAFLVDSYRAEVKELRPRDYVVSVLFFPHLIAGPLIHYRDIIPQFAHRFSISATTIWTGLPFFSVGLAKKVVIADNIAAFVAPLFAHAESLRLEFFSAWIAALGYTAQLYFDFSGYSDMAVGLGLMFGIVLPQNFDSPYKSLSVIEFWQRWHMTLSGFLREYLYIPLGGSRVATLRRYTNLLIVMLLGGLWHGAGWTFVAWGALHGLYLGTNRLWRDTIGKRQGAIAATRPLKLLCWLLTFSAVLVAWVFFRASTFTGALHVLAGMIGQAGVYLPHGIEPVGYRMSLLDMAPAIVFIGLAYAIALGAPNAFQLFGIDGRAKRQAGMRLAGTMQAAVVSALCWLSCFGVLGAAPSEFLYFQF